MRSREFDEKERLIKANEKLTKYKTAAGADAAVADAAGNFARGHKRFKGINAATKKQFDNDAKLSQLKEFAEQGVAEGPQDDPEDYRAHLLKTLPRMMNFLSKNVKGWKPTEEQYLAAIETGYQVMKHTGDVQQAGKAMSDELNTLHKMSQGQQGVAEGFSNDMSTEDMIAYLRQHHDKNLHQDYLNHITSTNSKFVLKNIPLTSIRTELSGLDRAKVEQYKQMDFSKAPPIVVGSDGNILDGYHRATVAKALGIPTIRTYVGVKGQQGVAEEWSQKYKNSINCSHPKGFSQRAHCAGKKKHNESIEMEMVCEDCGMCQSHGSLNEIKKGEKDSNGYTRCWPGRHAEGTKTGQNGGQVRNCVPIESIEESDKSDDRCQQCGMINCKCPGDSCKCKPIAGWIPNKGFRKAAEQVDEDQLDELSKDTLKNYVRAQPARIKGPAGLATTDNKKAARIVDRDIPRAMDKYKDPEYGHQQRRLPEDSLAAMRRLAGVSTPAPVSVPNGQRQYRRMPTAVQPR